jgi:hypothetical protein
VPFALIGMLADDELLKRYFLEWPSMSSVALPAESPVHALPSSLGTQNATVYTRHKPSCPKNGERIGSAAAA